MVKLLRNCSASRIVLLLTLLVTPLELLAASKSSQLLKDPQSYKPVLAKDVTNPNCVFYDERQYVAPRWVCEVPVENTSMSHVANGATVSEAYISGLVTILNSFGSIVPDVIERDRSEGFIQFKFKMAERSVEVEKYWLHKSAQFSEFNRLLTQYRIQYIIQNEVTVYSNFADLRVLNGQSDEALQFSSFSDTVLFTSRECDLKLINTYTKNDEHHFVTADMVNASSCSIYDVADYFDTLGIQVVKHITAPESGQTYLLLVMKEDIYQATLKNVFDALLQ